MPGANKRRIQQMANPTPPKSGRINVGYAVRFCKNCKLEFERIQKCPKCGSDKDVYIKYPKKDSFFSLSGVDDQTQRIFDELYRDAFDPKSKQVKPTRLKASFLFPPWDSVTVGWECWQASGLFCYNHWPFDHKTFLCNESDIAVRRVKGTLEEIPDFKCDPTTCPYAIGGKVQEQGKDKYIKPDRIPCKSKIVMDIYLTGMPGLNLFRVTSGGKKSIQNCLTGIQQMLMVLGGKWVPLMFELVVTWGEIRRPPSQGEGGLYFPKTHGPILNIVIPERLDALSSKSVVQIPGISRIAIPDHAGRSPDELVDIAHKALPEKGTEPVDLGTGKTYPDLPAKQAEPLIGDDTWKDVNELLKKLHPKNDKDRRRALARIKKTIGKSGCRNAALTDQEGKKIVKILNEVIFQQETTEYPLEEDTGPIDLTPDTEDSYVQEIEDKTK